jgi:hypothetical protein
VTHEAFHVAMDQAGEADSDFEGEPWVRRNFLVAADAIINEFRAESAVPPEVRSGDFRWDAVEILRTLRDALVRVASVEYQDHLDVGRLQIDIVEQCHTAWKLLGCKLAEHQDFETGEFTQLPVSTTSPDLWQRMAADFWPSFTEELSSVQPGSERVDRADLDALATTLADVLEQWLEALGFQWTQNGEEIYFKIKSWDFMQPEAFPESEAA